LILSLSVTKVTVRRHQAPTLIGCKFLKIASLNFRAPN
jgi:hypothetical protein